ncbi:MAG: RagB/SusD family nutrient uptake outer membrane protein [Bacteroidota bacterium]
MKNLKLKLVGFSLIGLLFTSCLDELETQPKIELSLEQLLAQDPQAIEGLLSKMYGTFALSGPKGPGSSDITGPDPGETAFLRGIINLQDFTADAMKNRWGDDGLDQLTTTKGWTANNKFFRYLYDRVYYTVPQSNNIIKVLKEGVDVANEEQYVSELRFLRSLAYFYMIDCFGKGVIVTENDLGSTTPVQESNRTQIFNYIESELIDIEGRISATNTYGRANKQVVRMLLAKLYMNAKVYTGTERYNDAIIYINKIITEGGYTLAPNFLANFSGDNNTSPEIIFPLLADPTTSQSFGNTTYIVNGSLSTDTMTLSTYGALQGWGGHRSTKAWYGLFGNSAAALAASPDERAHLFWTDGHSFEMNDYKVWTNGYPSIKFRNSNLAGGSSATDFSGTDFPLYRLADVYLMYAECALRGATGATTSQSLLYVNEIRDRANANPILLSELTLDFILDERGRELNFEGHRRTDLIRFGKFAGNTYIWPWKGGVAAGQSISANYNLFPIPTSALQANPNLTQNPGY